MSADALKKPPIPILHPADHDPTSGIGSKLRHIILGGQDGLVNVLGLTLGVATATNQVRVILVAGLAATLAESVAMTGVAYTSALADRDYYLKELKRERREVEEMPDEERAEIRHIFQQKGLSGEVLDKVVEQITSDKEVWVQVMMRDELQLEPKDTGTKLVWDSLLVGFSTIVGSLIPLIPFFFLPVRTAFWAAIVVSGLTLFGVGSYKAKTLVGDWRVAGGQMLAIGMASALAGYIIGRLLQA
jgi:predicted membrane protein (TIGR00267 family)